MSYRLNEEQTRKYTAKFTVNEWLAFRERLNKLIELNLISERDRKLLTEIIINNKSTEQLAYLAKTDEEYNWLVSNQNKPMSSRRILQILTQYFPEFHIQKSHKQNRKNQKIRTEQTRLRKVMITPDSCCGKCGSKDNLEIHHMLPVILGGDNIDDNLLILCRDCHQKVTTIYDEWLRKYPQIKDFFKNTEINPSE